MEFDSPIMHICICPLFFFLNSVLKSTAVRFDLSCMNQLVFIRFCLFYSGVEWSCYSERRAIYMNLTNWLHEW